ncbi:hypothetical protein LV476_08995 [Guyparkeria hydrothermalis]|uniref:pilus assembly protein n=1 Tax=Guyparkeria hydrothermalis TaxID=923 RepID=UPI002020A3DA|nr:PilC/PilY family type IV pilus protein [Guyparkeria hydrothermalis]MCL7745072.1 hypothetical protein [Guyparkeria hydrothermalis]
MCAFSSRLASFSRRLIKGSFVLVLGALPVGVSAFDEPAQSPLTVQEPVPPNVVLMLDDSHQMRQDYLPDLASIPGVFNRRLQDFLEEGPINNEPMINAHANRLYYDPTVRYLPPPRADGSAYPSYTDIRDVPKNGFARILESSTLAELGLVDAAVKVDLRHYVNDFYATNSLSLTDDLSGLIDTLPGGFMGAFTDRLAKAGLVDYNHEHSDGLFGETYAFFQYATGPASGPHTVHFVAGDAGDCGHLPSELAANCVFQDDASGRAAPPGVRVGTNIANWFAYHHTRMLTAKTGTMRAFAQFNPNYRVGFGSTNHDKLLWTALNRVPVYFGEDIFSVLSNRTAFARVRPWVEQKSNFWSWLERLQPNGLTTRLRRPLMQVGGYYRTDEPWRAMGSEAGAADAEKLSCRQSYAILATSSMWQGDLPTLSFLDRIGDADARAGASLGAEADGSIEGPDGRRYRYEAAPPFAERNPSLFLSRSTLADVAMYYWKNDLRTDLANRVPSNVDDPAFWQHMTTITVGLGLEPEGIEPEGTRYAEIADWARQVDAGLADAAAIDGFAWPRHFLVSRNGVADLAHAGLNGHGGFLQAGDLDEYTAGIRAVIANLGSQPGSGNGVAFDGEERLPGESLRFDASYVTGQWSGVVRAYRADDDGAYDLEQPVWDADGALPPWRERRIMTYRPGKGEVALAANNLSGSQKAALVGGLGVGFPGQPSVEEIVNFLRGDRRLELGNPGGRFRARKSLIGDVVHSSPVYVASPEPGRFEGRRFEGSDRHADFARDNADRDAMLYVAANDGMVHAFDAETGAERFAFLPGAVLRGRGEASLGRLAHPQYGAPVGDGGEQVIPHQYFHDGELTTSDVYIDGRWRTILVGTTGLGPSPAVYALDITDPDAIETLWERAADDGLKGGEAIGQVLGQPIIAQVPDPRTDDGKWVVLLGSGADDSAGKLLQFDLEDGELDTYSAGRNAGLSSPAVWQSDGTNGLSTDAYAGDLKGNIWHFDLGPSGGRGEVVFRARNDAGVAQSITAQPLLHASADDGALWLFVGTGRFLSEADVEQIDPAVQSWYGLRVSARNDGVPVVDESSSRTDLVRRRIVAEQDPANGEYGRATSAGDRADLIGHAGWYMDLVDPNTGLSRGERIVQPSQEIAGRIYVSTLIPEPRDICYPYPAGAVMAVDPFSGANPGQPFFDTNGDGVRDETRFNGDSLAFNGLLLDEALGGVLVGQKLDGELVLSGKTVRNGTVELSPPGAGVPFRRLSWREIVGG